MGGSVSTSSPKLLHTVEKNLINDLITKNCVVIFSKTQCIYCRKVKKLLTESSVPFLSIELDKREDGTNLQNALNEITGARTVPRVFINEECIGGASDVEKLQKENKLMEKIQMCGNKL
ncbi:glutaredoxin-2, mitochondrial [Trichonephila clavata]|uniref:Glutaredoxin-2, mitochondrial n=1 Tax=Trichonephila clavata TaxID=2740835 RepID=A0A8X6KL53_TRICU|nr:glutaredoxin-2, mitochondrial [Trichonephila clavata]